MSQKALLWEKKKIEVQQELERWAKRNNILEPDKQIELVMKIVNIPGTLLAGPALDAMLARPIEELNLSLVRSRKMCSRLGIVTIGQLVAKSADDLLEIKNFGVTSLAEVRAKLAKLGLRLKGD